MVSFTTLAPFRRRGKESSNNGDNTDGDSKKSKRPANTAFKQQRLKAWQPILTPKTVLPTLFIIGIIFAPIGGLLVWGSSLVSELTFDYTDCDTLTPSDANNPQFTPLPKFSYRLRSRDSNVQFDAPQWAFVQDNNNPNQTLRNQCLIQFDVPRDLESSVFLYYKLTNFYQNHRRYVKSLDTNQLKGKAVSVKTLQNGDCKPLAVSDDGTKAIYPCGLIANSLFNDTFSSLTGVNGTDGGYTFSERGIAWPGEARRYTDKPDYDPSQIVPPPSWESRFPDGYNDTNIPNLKEDEHFQNWMRTAGLPTFTKLYGRNDQDTLQAGTYQISVSMNFPVRPFKGTKSVVISTVSWIGGKNPFLGWAYVAASALFVLLAIAGTVRHLARPRRLGDMSLLSWNR